MVNACIYLSAMFITVQCVILKYICIYSTTLTQALNELAHLSVEKYSV